ncbi:hypothetical protein DFH05DRAFT_1115011 [Lentinula detonsa]|uniref:Uncharacterized protein n=1 Tax=Lentinula detonsa TaxID=2804962 RepID=A0A9W8P1Z9_9AGAR|nr:hypothetical protein DFH05DRAFT_1115011 [Lentinula detonsa]
MRCQPLPFLLLPGALFFLTFLSNLCAVVVGTAANRSIDDTLGDSVTGQRPIFLPATSGVWEDETCCALQPPTSSAFSGTYTAATYNSGLKNISITFDFTGTALYIFFILANNPAPGITATTAANFTLDGSLVGTFNHSPNSSAPDFQFNQSALVFSKTGLKNVTHQMVISTSGLSEDIWVNFDYALYTFQDAAVISSSESSSTTSSSNNPPSASASASSNMGAASSNSASSMHLGIVIGGVVGGLAVLGILLTVLFICHRRRGKQHQLERLNSHAKDDPESGIKDPDNLQSADVDSRILPKPTASTYGLMPGHQHHDAFRSSLTVHGTETPIGTTPTASPIDDVDHSCGPHTEVDGIYSPEYQYRSVISTLPSGRIVMAPGTTQDPLIPPLPSSTNSESISATTTVPKANTTPEKSELRRIRQQELERQMVEIHEEIEELRNEAAERSDPSSLGLASRTSIRKKSVRKGKDKDQKMESVAQLKAQIRQMSEQIALLQAQQNSAWAQGLSDEPPPGYSPRPLVVNGA